MGERLSYPAEQFRVRQRAFLRANKRPLIGLVLVAVGVGALSMIWMLLALPASPWSGWFVGFTQALLLMSFVVLLRSAHLSRDPEALRFYRGALGESSTTDELRSARRSRLVWGAVDGVAVQGGDVDHVVVTRHAGVWAVDSKYLSSTDRLDLAAASARRSARRAELVLRSLGSLRREHGARHRHDAATIAVRPLVVVWGRARESLLAEQDVDGVRVVRGDRLGWFIRQQVGEDVDRGVAAELLDALEQFRERVRTTG